MRRYTGWTRRDGAAAAERCCRGVPDFAVARQHSPSTDFGACCTLPTRSGPCVCSPTSPPTSSSRQRSASAPSTSKLPLTKYSVKRLTAAGYESTSRSLFCGISRLVETFLGSSTYRLQAATAEYVSDECAKHLCRTPPTRRRWAIPYL